MLADHGLALSVPRLRHVLLAASFVAHFLVIGWLVMPARIEQVTDRRVHSVVVELQLLGAPHQPCITVWVERQDGCVVTRHQICARAAASLGEGWRVVKPESTTTMP